MNITPAKSSQLFRVSLFTCLAAITGQLHAADISRADNTTVLNLTGAWSGGVVPGSGDVAVWDNTVTVNRSSAIGGNLFWSGIRIANTGGTLMTIGTTASSVLDLGSAGIDMSAANADLTVSTVTNFSANQSWSIASGRTLQLNPTTSNTGSASISITGPGNLMLANGTAQMGTGTVTLGGGIRITSNGSTGRTINNNLILNGYIGIGSTSATPLNGTITLSGSSIDLGNATRTISLQNSVTDGSVTTMVIGSSANTVAITNGTLALVNGNASGTIRVFLGMSGSSFTPSITSNLNVGANVVAALPQSNALSTSTDLTVDGRLRLGNTSSASSSNTVKSLSGSGAIDSGQGSGTNIGTLVINGGASTGTTTFSGLIENGAFGSVAITKSGANTQILTGTNTYTGATTVSAGTLALNGGTIGSGGGTAITVASGATLTENSTGVIAGTSSLTTSGTTTLSGVNTYTGTTTISAGTLVADGNTAGVLASGGAFSFGGGTFDYKSTNGIANTQTIGTVAVTTGTSTIQSEETGGGSSTLTIGAITRTAGATINLLTIGGASAVLKSTSAMTLNRGVFYNGEYATATAGGAIGAVVYGTTAGTSNASGVLTVTSGNYYNLTGTASGSANANFTTGTIRFGGNYTFSPGTTNSIGGFLTNGTTGIIASGGSLRQNGEMVFATNGGSDTLTVNSPIIAFNATSNGTVTKTGPGQLVVAAGNTYLGNTYVNQGTFQSTNATGLGFGGTIGVINTGNSSTTVSTGATLDLAPATTMTVNEAIVLKGSASLINSGSGTTTIDNGIAAINLTNLGTGGSATSGSATISGTGSGATVGTLTLTAGAITGLTQTAAGSGYTGTPTVTFTITGQTTPSAATPILSSLTLNGANTIGGAGNLVINAVVANGTSSGGFSKTGNGTLTLSAANTYTGATTIGAGTLSVGTIGDGGVAGNLGQATNTAANLVFDGGTLQYTGANATSNRAFTINAGKTATINTANNLSLAGATGTATTGALTKTGAGTLTLTGTNTYTGLTTISSGTLALGTSSSIAGSINLGTIGSQGTLNLVAMSSGYTFGSGQTLAGFGTVDLGGTGHLLTIASGATLAPGNSPGIVNVTGDLALAGTTSMEIAGTATDGNVTTGFDQVIVTGSLTFGGSLGITAYNAYSLATTVGSYKLFTFTSESGDFSSVTVAGTALNLNSGVWANTVGGYDITFTESNGTLAVALAAAIPEPSSFAAFAGALALAGSALIRRRKHIN